GTARGLGSRTRSARLPPECGCQARGLGGYRTGTHSGGESTPPTETETERAGPGCLGRGRASKVKETAKKALPWLKRNTSILTKGLR
ncbi:hypothetical protein TIFTF001_052375, partial [Ficus carica]